MLAAKLGVDAEETRRAYPRIAEVPFDSDYKFMATFHRVTLDGSERVIQLVKGGPDVVLARCTTSGGPMSGSQVPIEEARADIDAANERMGEKGLRVLAFAARLRRRRRARRDGRRPDVAHARPRLRRHGRDHRPAAGRRRGRRPDRARRRHRRAHDHRRPRGHRAGDRRDARARPGRDQRQRAAGAVGRGGEAPASRAARLRPGLAAGQAPARPADAGAGADRGDDRRRGQRRRRAEAGRHRRGDGQRQRGDQAGRPDDPHRRQLRHARATPSRSAAGSTRRSSPTSATR